MPATDALQPPLSETEREICKSYGGWTNFMHSSGLKPWNDEDQAEGKTIIAAFASDKDEDNTANKTNKANNSASSGS
ncbi:hypothetical protein GGS23DRAFT_601786 [Durotheca rogersii]|uniref:uncharacterized protein n=1 Tax=Durotheca rogersii TaxID=419775 RepID=UPI00221F03E3|nr:uncharacterized protein GGS23DRAFT_601786 [Durotheca rogersii]KAI5852059.1 hypothetical protein GGS23DRAFT_601786 [Durotheca rogersii]